MFFCSHVRVLGSDAGPFGRLFIRDAGERAGVELSVGRTPQPLGMSNEVLSAKNDSMLRAPVESNEQAGRNQAPPGPLSSDVRPKEGFRAVLARRYETRHFLYLLLTHIGLGGLHVTT